MSEKFKKELVEWILILLPYAAIILFLLVIDMKCLSQPCNSHDDCTTTLPCNIATCYQGVCKVGFCQDIEIDCRNYDGTCSNRRCNYTVPCCCIMRSLEAWQIPYYLRMEKRKADQRYAEATKPKFDVTRFYRIKKNKELCLESLKS